MRRFPALECRLTVATGHGVPVGDSGPDPYRPDREEAGSACPKKTSGDDREEAGSACPKWKAEGWAEQRQLAETLEALLQAWARVEAGVRARWGEENLSKALLDETAAVFPRWR